MMMSISRPNFETVSTGKAVANPWYSASMIRSPFRLAIYTLSNYRAQLYIFGVHVTCKHGEAPINQKKLNNTAYKNNSRIVKNRIEKSVEGDSILSTVLTASVRYHFTYASAKAVMMEKISRKSDMPHTCGKMVWENILTGDSTRSYHPFIPTFSGKTSVTAGRVGFKPWAGTRMREEYRRHALRDPQRARGQLFAFGTN